MTKRTTQPDKPTEITFSAALADTQSAITLHGSGDGGRTTLDVPRSDVGALLLLQQYGSGMLLEVTIKFIAPQAKPTNLDESKPDKFAALFGK